ncbi:IS3 family transposase [Streptomyces sp. CHA1]|nr:IS3 family transposase [Streptomyces sp. CHB9.2]MCO6713778.1 IS3 family transposase [Streptomyces sp. CHB19.2]MCO6720147.1 IS3 family transposase [Streptomyces sp. Vc714c-19]MCO6725668.1 IS3 family transposase [Streptomyces sp. CHA16]MCO6737542.1 IS3 family transposase [Streptomyces sp. CHA15]MCO6741973.1 IS3 family transposase [Streptomyces sp. CHA1]
MLLCRVLHVARSSCYAWREGEAARQARRAADDALAHEITALHIASRKTYGVPRIHAELRRLEHRVNRKRIDHVMRERDIRGVTRRKHRSPGRKGEAGPGADLLRLPRRASRDQAGRRHHLSPDGRGLALPRLPAGPGHPRDRRLCHGRPPPRRARRRRPRHGLRPRRSGARTRDPQRSRAASTHRHNRA